MKELQVELQEGFTICCLVLPSSMVNKRLVTFGVKTINFHYILMEVNLSVEVSLFNCGIVYGLHHSL